MRSASSARSSRTFLWTSSLCALISSLFTRDSSRYRRSSLSTSPRKSAFITSNPGPQDQVQLQLPTSCEATGLHCTCHLSIVQPAYQRYRLGSIFGPVIGTHVAPEIGRDSKSVSAHEDSRRRTCQTHRRDRLPHGGDVESHAGRDGENIRIVLCEHIDDTGGWHIGTEVDCVPAPPLQKG